MSTARKISVATRCRSRLGSPSKNTLIALFTPQSNTAPRTMAVLSVILPLCLCASVVKRFRQALLAGFVAGTLFGCATTRYAWQKVGATPEDFQRDSGACQMQALKLRPNQPTPLVVNNYTIAPDGDGQLMNAVNQNGQQQQANLDAWAEVYRQRDYYNACMMSKGWSLQPVPK